MEAWILQARKRNGKGKGEAGRLRREGQVPAMLYGKESGNIPLSLDAGKVEQMVRAQGGGGLVKLQLGEAAELQEFITLLKEVQRDPLQRRVEHLDLYQVSAMEKVQAMVPVHLVGEAPGAAHGGVLQHGLREVLVECLPGDLPEALVVDLSALELGGRLTVADLEPPEGVKVLSEHESVLALLLMPRREEEKPAPAASDDTSGINGTAAGKGDTGI